REVRAEEFPITVFTTELEPDELLVAARVPVLGPGWGWSFREVSRRRGDFALVSAAALVRSAPGGGAGGTVVEARLALGGGAARPVRLGGGEGAAAGGAPGGIAARGGEIKGLRPGPRPGGGREFRRPLARVVARPGLEEACARSEGTVSGEAGT